MIRPVNATQPKFSSYVNQGTPDYLKQRLNQDIATMEGWADVYNEEPAGLAFPQMNNVAAGLQMLSQSPEAVGQLFSGLLSGNWPEPSKMRRLMALMLFQDQNRIELLRNMLKTQMNYDMRA